MNFDKAKGHHYVSIISLFIAIVALPFSVTVCHAGIILFTLNWISNGNWKAKWQIIQTTPILWPFILFLLLNLIGLIYTENLSNGLFNIEKKLTFCLLPIIFATSDIEKKNFQLLLKSFVATCLVAVMICVFMAWYKSSLPPEARPLNFDYFTLENFRTSNPNAYSLWSYFSYIELSSGIHMHPTYLGTYLLFSIIILIWFWDTGLIASSAEKLITLSLLLIFSIIIFLLSSRIVLVCYFSVSFLIACWLFFKNKKPFILVVFFALMVINATILFVNPISRYRMAQEISYTKLKVEPNKQYTQSLDIRYSMWWLGVESFKENNWIIGVGPGDVTDVMKNTSIKYNISNILNSNDPHSQFLYTAIGIGIFGILTLLACLVSPLFNEYTRHRFLFPAFILIVFVTCLTESFLELQKGIVFFSLFYSLLTFPVRSHEILNMKLSHA